MSSLISVSRLPKSRFSTGMLTTMTVFNIMTRFLPWEGRDANRPWRLRRHQHCAPMSFPLADIAAKHSSICRRISMLFRKKTRHATAPNTTTSTTDVPCYRMAIITTTLVVDESLGIYPTIEGCGVPGPFYQNFPSIVTPP